MSSPSALIFPRILPLALAVASCAFASAAQAQQSGLAAMGSTGGLFIPSAQVLPQGHLQLGYGNYFEPEFNNLANRPFIEHDNYYFGIGILPNVELHGRLLNLPYNRSGFVQGARDLSFNVKAQLPQFFELQPKLAVGVNDISGNRLLGAAYVVASDSVAGFVHWSAGYAKGKATPGGGNAKTFDGAFAGLEVPVGETGLAVMAEYANKRKLAGLRYTSAPIAVLAQSQVSATLTQSSAFGDRFGRNHKQTGVQVGLQVPLHGNSSYSQFALNAAAVAPLAPIAPSTRDIAALQQALQHLGLERVRVGKQDKRLWVEYENHQYKQNEADAIGLVLALAAEMAPTEIERLSAVTLKNGKIYYATTVARQSYREYLRDQCSQATLEASLEYETAPDYRTSAIDWFDAKPTPYTRARITLKPELIHAIGTELGVYDYSLAANWQINAPLGSSGLELQANYLTRVADSELFKPNGFLSGARLRNGLKNINLQYSAFLHPQVYTSVGVGKYNYDYVGTEGEAYYYLPAAQGVLRLRGGSYQRSQNKIAGLSNRFAVGAVSYRHQVTNTLWLEAGAQKYSDGSQGPTFELTRWFGDSAVHAFLRQGGKNKYAGLELSLPLTPRRLDAHLANVVSLEGTERFKKGLRTSIAKSNFISPNSVREFEPAYNAESMNLNSGRLGRTRLMSELPRMRDAFYAFGRGQLP